MLQAFFPLLQTNGETVNRADAGAGVAFLNVVLLIYFIPANRGSG